MKKILLFFLLAFSPLCLGALPLPDLICPIFFPPEQITLPSGLRVVVVKTASDRDEVVGFVSLPWGGEERHRLCLSSLAHEGDETGTSFLRRIDLAGGWRNGACPARRCSLQFGIPDPRLRQALQVVGERFLVPTIGLEIVANRLKYVPVDGIDPASFAPWCTRQNSLSGATLIVVGNVQPSEVFSMAASVFGQIRPGWPETSPREVRTLEEVLSSMDGDWFEKTPEELREMSWLESVLGIPRRGYSPQTSHLGIAALVIRTVP